MTTEFFTGINPIVYKGVDSTDPLSFRYYNPEEIVLGKRMEDQIDTLYVKKTENIKKV